MGETPLGYIPLLLVSCWADNVPTTGQTTALLCIPDEKLVCGILMTHHHIAPMMGTIISIMFSPINFINNLS
jgi:hypothetical protein